LYKRMRIEPKPPHRQGAQNSAKYALTIKKTNINRARRPSNEC
jgi:hypothetical protein